MATFAAIGAGDEEVLVPNFLFEAASRDGAVVRGTIEAASRAAAVERIMALGRTPVRVVEQGVDSLHTGEAAEGRPLWGAAQQRLALLRELSLLLHAGLSVERALVVMQGLAVKHRTKATIAHLLDGLRGGEALSGAMRRAEGVFPETLRKLVAAGEVSGRLKDVVARLASAYARNKDLADRAISALIYPALLVVVMLAVLTMIFTVVLPRLEPLFAQSGAALPWPAAVLVAISHIFNDYGLWLAALLIVAVFGGLLALRGQGSKFALDRFAITSRVTLDLPRRYEAAQFCRNLAMLIEGGMPLNRALEAAEGGISNRYMRSHLTKVLQDVRQGRPLSWAFDKANVFPRLVVEFAAVGEETGHLAPMLDKAADLLDSEVQIRLDRLSALLLPTVTVALGIVVAAIMSGVVSGILAANEMAL